MEMLREHVSEFLLLNGLITFERAAMKAFNNLNQDLLYDSNFKRLHTR